MPSSNVKPFPVAKGRFPVAGDAPGALATGDKAAGGKGHPQPVAANPALTRLLQSRRVLLLQGPVGPFYDRLAKFLQQGGAAVDRVVFQAGDAYDCRALTPIPYKGTLDDWPDFFSALLRRLDTDCVVLFGQARRHHQHAVRLCKVAGIPVVVLEEGYFRPGFATMELGGVNGYSTTMQEYVWQPPPGDSAGIQPDISPWHFQKMAFHAAMHYAAMWRGRAAFPNYRHHKDDNPFHYAAYWMRSWRRKLLRRGPDRNRQRALFGGGRPYYFVPLQHDGDAQITHHSPFAENTDFIIKVVRSFAEFAPADSMLVFRQHPHARGGPGHSRLIHSLAADLGVGSRVVHMVEGDTPDLAEHSAGVVLINSTVGLQTLERGAPLMVLGDSLYKQPHLTYTGELDHFWTRAQRPNRAAARQFLAQAKNLTQASVSLYANRDEPLVWPAPQR